MSKNQAWFARTSLLCVLSMLFLSVGFAAVAPEPAARFESLVIYDPISRMGQLGDDPGTTEGFEQEVAQWNAFRSSTGGSWDVRLDRRSGTPLLVRGSGIKWFNRGEEITTAEMAQRAQAFLQDHGLLLKVDNGELVLREEGSGAWDQNHHLVQFDRYVGGVLVENQTLRFVLSHGNLVMFGADRWGATPAMPEAHGDATVAREQLYTYMGLEELDVVNHVVEPELLWIAMPSDGEVDRRYEGPVGQGVQFALVWRFVVSVNDGIETWVGKVDAVTGEVHAFYDDTQYAQAKGGVYPVSYEGVCAEGCSEVPNYPMPYVDVTIDGTSTTANDMGLFDCSPFGSNASMSLSGPYVLIDDECGPVSEAVTCDNDLDLQFGPGTDCAVPAGASAGNTHASRTCYYHVNRLMEKGRYYLPSRSWLSSQITCRTNVNSNCNATYGGSRLNMYTTGGGCGNTGETAGVVQHEYGHGLDQNDGGGSDNSSEAYADVVAIFEGRISCIGPGFRTSANCGGYGDSCLDCTGVRDHDWSKRQRNTPATPANFTDGCGGGSGPCGKSVHCESYVPSETIFDLATRDFPAAGLDQETSWQLAEKLWYSSRLGSGGNILNCSLPNADGCGAGNWFMEMMTMDDDDGNLANGTPHAAAIFAAFDRHGHSCGLATDPENQNSNSCPAIAAPVLTATNGSAAVTLDWNDVSGANEYLVFRTENGCDLGQNVIATVPSPTTSFVDDELANGLTEYYRVQAVGSNPACDSPVSNCVAATPQAFDGSIKFGSAVYQCTNVIELQVTDANVGAGTVDVTVFSSSETTPETLTLTETEPGSAQFVGSIQATTAPSINGDGLLEVRHFDSLTAEYIDADDGEGGSGILKTANSSADCVDLVRTSLSLDDSVGGNGDGILDPGEWVDLPIEIQNTGDDVAQNVTVQVESLTSFAEVRVASSALPNMPGGSLASTNAGGHLQIRLTNGLPCTEPVPLRFTYSADNELVTQDDTFPSGTKTTVDFDDFEAATTWAHVASESDASTGDWIVGDPDGTQYQPENDTTPDPGVNALFTQPNGGGLGTDDIDDGVVVARSGEFDLSGFPEARVAMMRWFANRDTGEDSGDFWRFHVRESSTSPDVLLEELDTNQSAAQWTEVTFRLADFVSDLSSVSFRVAAADGPATGNLVEAAIDDFRFWDPTCEEHDPAPNAVESMLVTISGADLSLDWDRPALDPSHGEAVRYRVYRSITVQNGFSEQDLLNDTSPTVNWLDTGAAADVEPFYAYLVVSENDNGAAEPPPAP